MFPSTLKYLFFGRDFNQVIGKGVLPRNLVYLRFGYYFNQSLTIDVLPPALTRLELGLAFTRFIEEIPASLMHICVDGVFRDVVRPHQDICIHFGPSCPCPMKFPMDFPIDLSIPHSGCSHSFLKPFFRYQKMMKTRYRPNTFQVKKFFFF